VLLVHFSGHGLKSESGELFFAAANTRPNRLGSTAVSADFVQRCMAASRSRSVVLLLDCCYGGAFAQGVKVRAAGNVNVLDSFPQDKTGGGRGRAVITASSAMEFAFEGDQLGDSQPRRPSVFTSALVQGLATGDADRDEDGWVALGELYDYVFDKVREQNPHQTPSRQVQLEGELYLARSRRRRIRPAPIPPDLQAALTDPNMYTRLGAVSELRDRLANDHLPTAAGAYEALAELARTDIGYVADPAAAALSQAALQPEETELHFGEIAQGSPAPHRTVRLLGPPIARACAPRASHDWIQVSETAGGFDISVDTAHAGILHGTLALKGPTGEAAIAIDVELLPPPSQEQARQQAEREAEEQARQQAEQAAEQAAQEQARQQAEQAAEQAAQEQARQQAEQAAQEQARQQAEREAEEQARQQAEQAAQDRALAAPGSRTAPQQTTPPASPLDARPAIQTRAAYAGSVIALLSGVTGLIEQILYIGPDIPGFAAFFTITANVVLTAAATAALVRIHRMAIAGFLQGMLWLAVPALAWDLVAVSVYHLSGFTSRQVAAYSVGVPSDVLGLTAAILLMVSWAPVADRRRIPRLRALPVMLLCGVGLSQVAEMIFAVNAFQYTRSAWNALYVTAILVGLAVTWYAVSLRARVLGGALVLGWVTFTAMFSLAWMADVWSSITGATRTWGVLGCVLLAIVAILTVIYIREPSHLEPGHLEE
jgi:Caspase domain